MKVVTKLSVCQKREKGIENTGKTLRKRNFKRKQKEKEKASVIGGKESKARQEKRELEGTEEEKGSTRPTEEVERRSKEEGGLGETETRGGKQKGEETKSTELKEADS